MYIPQQVLVFSGHDPTGGAGIQADIETLFQFKAHAIPIITCLTSQNSHNVLQLMPLSKTQIQQQVRPILEDLNPCVIKLGLLGSLEVLDTVVDIIKQCPDLPVIVDPILSAGGGKDLTKQDFIQQFCQKLLPLTDILTPNSEEARRLSGEMDLDKSAEVLLQRGCKAVLITGTHENSIAVNNTLYQHNQPPQTLTWQRLAHEYHGSGCTLTAAISAGIAQGLDVVSAIKQAQTYTWQALETAYPLGSGQLFPQRKQLQKILLFVIKLISDI